MHPPRPRPRHAAARIRRRLRGLPRATAARGCTCGSAWSAGTSAAATTRPTSTRRSTRRATQHPIIRSLEPGEDWSWCFPDELRHADRRRAGPDAHPAVADARRLTWTTRSCSSASPPATRSLRRWRSAWAGCSAPTRRRCRRWFPSAEHPSWELLIAGGAAAAPAAATPAGAMLDLTAHVGAGRGARRPRSRLRDRPRRPDRLTPPRAARGRGRRVPHPRPRLANGTYANGRAITSTRLHEGDAVTFGLHVVQLTWS